MLALRNCIALTASLVLAVSAADALAQEPPSRVACDVVNDAALPAHLQAYPLAAAVDAEGLSQAVLPLGRAVDAQLKRTAEVAFPVLPARPGGTVSYGGLLELRIEAAGEYQVSLGTGAWIEVVSGKTLVESIRHGPGPACSSLKKTVVFPLKPGRYVLEITGNGDPTLPVMVTHLAK